MTSLIQRVASDQIIDQAFSWLCKARENSHYNHDVWHLRFHWQKSRGHLKQQLLAGDYQFEPCRAINVKGESMGLWCARDALVLKALALVLTKHLAPGLSQHCYHLPTRGGTKNCVRHVKQSVEQYQFVCRSDVDSYYASINHRVLLKQLSERIYDTHIITLIKRMLARLDDVNGELFTVSVGIGKGNPLSPLLGALYLYPMDKALGEYCQKRQLKYFRFMDDWVVLCKTRYQLRDVVRLMNHSLTKVKQHKHPYKTYIGRIKSGGFDFLGYRIVPDKKEKVTLAWKTIANHIGKLKQLYEQGATKTRIAEYVKRWLQWVRSGIAIDLNIVIQMVVSSQLSSTLPMSDYWAMSGIEG